jgi:hypothetical protein
MSKILTKEIKKLILEVLDNNTTIEHSDVEGDYEYLDIEGFKKELNDTGKITKDKKKKK